jgi:hypothetical protein
VTSTAIFVEGLAAGIVKPAGSHAIDRLNLKRSRYHLRFRFTSRFASFQVRKRLCTNLSSQRNLAHWVNSFHSCSTALAMSFAALRSQFGFLARKSFNTLLILFLLPKCTFAASQPIAWMRVSSSRFFGRSSMSIGLESGESLRISHVPTISWNGSRDRTALEIIC